MSSQALVLGVGDSDLGVRTKVTLVEKSVDNSIHTGCGRKMTIESILLAHVLKAQCYECKLFLVLIRK